MYFVLVLAAALLSSEPQPAYIDAGHSEVTVQNDPVALLKAFNRRWAHEDSPPVEVRQVALEEAEKGLAFTYPSAYRDAILAVGLPQPTADLWDAIGEEPGLPDLSDFLLPDEIVEAVRDWSPMGYPTDLAPFATDSQGNLLSFRRGDPTDAVYIWDHDFGTVETVAPSFVAFLEAYCRLPESEA